MNLKKLLYLFKPPCPKCPYTLGDVQFVDCPCPQCKAEGYKTFAMLITRYPARKQNATAMIPFTKGVEMDE